MSMFAGTGRLIRLVLRRDRIKLPLWIIGIVSFAAMMVPTLKEAYGTPAEWQMIYNVINTNPAGRLLAGTMDEASFGALLVIETVLYVGLLVAFMNTLLVVRHTRKNEELGSSELLQSARVGRLAGLTAVLIVALAANALIAVGIAVSFMGEVLLSTSGAWLYGIGMGALGLCFAAVAAVTSQLSSSSRGANSLAAMVIGVTFLLRGVGDIMASTGSGGVMWPHWASWLSPFGWIQLTRSLTLEHWWPLAISTGFIVAVTSLAYVLLVRRDVGAGILPARKGRDRASDLKRTPIGFALYIQRNIFIGWLIGAVVTALAIGVLSDQVSDIYGESEVVSEYLAAMGGAGELTATFLSAMMSFIALMALAYLIQSLARARGEEASGHLESLLGTALGRVKWLSSHVAVAVSGSLVIMLVSGVSLAVTVGLVMGDWQVAEYTAASLSYLPLMLLFAGIFVLLMGLLPRLATLTVWLLFAFVVFISQLGAILKLPEWIINLSPLSHVAAAPAQSIEWQPLLVMTALAFGLLLAGLVAFRSRSLTTS